MKHVFDDDLDKMVSYEHSRNPKNSKFFEKLELMKMELLIGKFEYKCLFSKMVEVRKINSIHHELFIDGVSICEIDPNAPESPYIAKIQPLSKKALFIGPFFMFLFFSSFGFRV